MRHIGIAVAIGSLTLSPAVAQDVLPTDGYIQQSTDIGVTTLNNRTVERAARSRPMVTNPQHNSSDRRAEACAKRKEFAAKHGKDNPKVKLLFRLCAEAGC
jgi:hypothetical protein